MSTNHSSTHQQGIDNQPTKPNSKNKKSKNRKKPKIEPVPLTPITPPTTNFASDLHDGRPGFATSQNVPKEQQLGPNGFRQNIQNNSTKNNTPESGYLSIHH